MHQHLRKLNQPVYVTLKKYSTEPLAPPSNEKVYPEHIVSLVDSISKLNLLEVSHLNELLKVVISSWLGIFNHYFCNRDKIWFIIRAVFFIKYFWMFGPDNYFKILKI